MKTKLDESHKCLLEGWDTFLKMRTCESEIERFLQDAAKSAIQELRKRYGGQKEFVVVEKPLTTDKDNPWFNIFRASLEDSRGEQPKLVFGIEGISVNGLLLPSSNCPCRAYAVWEQEVDPDPAGLFHKWRQAFRMSLPSGFVEFKGADYEQWFCLKPLAPIEPGQLIDAQFLVGHFVNPLATLFDWYSENKRSLLA